MNPYSADDAPSFSDDYVEDVCACGNPATVEVEDFVPTLGHARTTGLCGKCARSEVGFILYYSTATAKPSKAKRHRHDFRDGDICSTCDQMRAL
jgi:hypothetical protein